MLKPMGMKAKALPTPPEWQAAGAGGGAAHIAASATSAALPVYNAAALRIQVRYLRYQNKVRALLKKGDRLSDGTQSQPQQDASGAAPTASKAAAARDRGVTGSSMALAVAIQASTSGGGKDAADTTAESSVARQKPAPPAYSAADGRAGARPGPSTWRSSNPAAWSVPPVVITTTRVDGEPDGEESGSDDGGVGSSNCSRTRQTAEDGAALATSGEDEDARAERVPSGFVNVMQSSWLLSSVEQRCRQQGGDNGPERSLSSVADLGHLMLDMLFIFRSGVDVNLHGRPPSSVAVHRQNLLTRVSERVLEDGGELSREDEHRVARIFRGLQSDMVMPAVRCLGWILTKTWRLLFHGLHVDIGSLHRVREILEAAEGDVSVVFTPTHKTHLDYLIISYLCFAYGIPLPRIAAGNNLDLPLIGSFLRANGSFFIRRSFRGDELYQQVLEHYVHELLSDGNPVEVFIEGGRSRHGRVCKPRLGFLSMFLDYVRRPLASDADMDADKTEESKKTVLLVPISLDYDKVYEVEEYANQLLGKPKEKESLKVFFKSVWDIVFLRCGHTYVRFGEPVALTAESSLDDVAHAVATRMQTAGTVTATAVVSALLMWKRSYVTREMLVARAVWLVQELEARGATVAHDDDDDLVDHALAILGVKVAANGVVSPHAEFPVRALELGFYRNHVLHVFLPEMAVAGAIDCLLRSSECAGSDPGLVVSLDVERVVHKARSMWRFLRHICRHDDVDVAQQVAQFVESTPACSSDGSTISVNTQRWRTSKTVGLLLSLHWSFADSLWLSTLGLWSLGGDDSRPPTDREFVRRVQALAKDLFLRKQLQHAEALCGETIKQAVDFLVERSVVRRELPSDGTAGRVLVLTADDRDVDQLAREVNEWRRPREFLWRSSVAPEHVSRELARELLVGAGASIYARWMAPPV